MKRVLIAALLAMPCHTAFAQQTVSPNEQALGAKLMLELQAGLSCSAEKITLQGDLVKAQARIKELESKVTEPKNKEN